MKTKHLMQTGLLVTLFTLAIPFSSAQVSSPVNWSKFGIRGEADLFRVGYLNYDKYDFVTTESDYSFAPSVGFYWKYRIFPSFGIKLSADIHYFSKSFRIRDNLRKISGYTITLSRRKLYELAVTPMFSMEFIVGRFSFSPGIGFQLPIVYNKSTLVANLNSSSYSLRFNYDLDDDILHYGILQFDTDFRISDNWRIGFNVACDVQFDFFYHLFGIHTSYDF